MLNRDWLGSKFLESQPLKAEFRADGSIASLHFLGEFRQIEVHADLREARTREQMDPDLTLEEWLEGWKHQLLSEAHPEAFVPTCSFCGKTQNEVSRLIAGPTVMICNECIDLCQDILNS